MHPHLHIVLLTPGSCPYLPQNLQPTHGVLHPPMCHPSPYQYLRVPACLSPLTPPTTRPLLCVNLTPLHPLWYPQYFLQGFAEICLQILLAPPRVSPAPSPLISRLPCAYLKYRPQRHPLCHCPLSSSDVGCSWLGSSHLPHLLRPWCSPHTFFLLLRPFSCDFS